MALVLPAVQPQGYRGHHADMIQKKNLGNAGEFYVLAQLAQRGFVAGKTDDGQTLIDVIATEPETLQTVNIQVKTTSSTAKVPRWIMSSKNELVFDSLWYVLVRLTDPDHLPSFYVFHSNEIGPWLKADHAGWLAGDPSRKDSKVRNFRPTADELAERANAWDRMFGQAQPGS